MSANSIPEKHRDLLNAKALAHLATIMADGSPQVTPVWFDFDGEYIIINSARGRVKDLNMRRDPRVSVEITDPANPYRYLQIRGRVVEVTEEGADAVIDHLAHKYLGVDSYPYRNGSEVRVTYRIAPERATTMG